MDTMRKSRLSQHKQDRLQEQFCSGNDNILKYFQAHPIN